VAAQDNNATQQRPPFIGNVLSFSMTAPNAVVASWKKRDVFKYDSTFIGLTRNFSPEGRGYYRMAKLQYITNQGMYDPHMVRRSSSSSNSSSSSR